MKHYALKLSGVIFVIFLLQNIFPFIDENFVLVSKLAFDEPWRLLTAIFLHGSLVHLLNNLLALALFGSILEHVIKSKKFLILFFVSGLVSSLSVLMFYNAALGASGAIFGLLGALVILRPKMTVWVSYFPMPMFVAGIVWALIDIIRFSMPTGIASAAHLSGLFVGLIFGIFYRKKFKEKIIDNKIKIVESWRK